MYDIFKINLQPVNERIPEPEAFSFFAVVMHYIVGCIRPENYQEISHHE